MHPIVTVTLNPSIDGASEADKVMPTHKIRTSHERYDPGGGGINVARVVRELGGQALALHTAGGDTGSVLAALLDRFGIPRRAIPIRDHTRISHVVYERASGLEYRFVPEGPALDVAECEAVMSALAGIPFDMLVISGSLPRGAEPELYCRMIDLAAAKDARVVLDTSGPALAQTLAHGGTFLVKPSLGEFEALTGRTLVGIHDIGEAARAFVLSGAAELVAVTMGHEGALLASRNGVVHRRAPDVPVRSAVGAGDSFVAGMTHGLVSGLTPRDAFLLGMAAGTAAVLTPGTEMCKRPDVERLYARLTADEVPSATPSGS